MNWIELNKAIFHFSNLGFRPSYMCVLCRSSYRSAIRSIGIQSKTKPHQIQLLRRINSHHPSVCSEWATFGP
jgi:hypothetical protein